MGLTKCSDCGQEISDRANACPSCGRSTHRGARKAVWLEAVMLLGVLFVLFGAFVVPQTLDTDLHRRAFMIIGIALFAVGFIWFLKRRD